MRYWPLTNSFLLLGVLTSVPILVKIDQEMRPWECSQTDTHTLTDGHTDRRKPIFNLFHTICHSYGTDNKIACQSKAHHSRTRYMETLFAPSPKSAILVLFLSPHSISTLLVLTDYSMPRLWHRIITVLVTLTRRTVTQRLSAISTIGIGVPSKSPGPVTASRWHKKRSYLVGPWKAQPVNSRLCGAEVDFAKYCRHEIPTVVINNWNCSWIFGTAPLWNGPL